MQPVQLDYLRKEWERKSSDFSSWHWEVISVCTLESEDFYKLVLFTFAMVFFKHVSALGKANYLLAPWQQDWELLRIWAAEPKSLSWKLLWIFEVPSAFLLLICLVFPWFFKILVESLCYCYSFHWQMQELVIWSEGNML